MELSETISKIESFIAELETIYKEGILHGKAEFGWEGLDRWKRRVSRFLAANVSDEEAQGFQGGEDIFTDLGDEINKCKDNLVALLGVLRSDPESVIDRPGVETALAPRDRKGAGADDHLSTTALDMPKRGTLSWLWENVPVRVWWLLLTSLVIAFIAGVYFGNYPPIRDILRTITGHPRENKGPLNGG